MIDLERVRTLADRFVSEGFVTNERDAVRYAIQVLAAADALSRPESAAEARHFDYERG